MSVVQKVVLNLKPVLRHVVTVLWVLLTGLKAWHVRIGRIMRL